MWIRLKTSKNYKTGNNIVMLIVKNKDKNW